CDHEIAVAEPACIAQSGGDGRSARSSDENPLVCCEGSGRLEGFGIAYPDPLVDDLAVERLGHEIFADPLDFPGTLRIAGEDRAFRISADDLDAGIALFEVPADARDRPPRTDPGDERGHPATGLFPDLGSGLVIVDVGVCEVGELVRPPGAGNL